MSCNSFFLVFSATNKYAELVCKCKEEQLYSDDSYSSAKMEGGKILSLLNTHQTLSESHKV